MNQQSEGALYIAFGFSYVAEAIMSIKSLKLHMPQLPVMLMTDRAEQLGELRGVEVKLVKPSHVRAKIDFIADSPFEKTLYLDSDTLINHSLQDIFDLLQVYDVVGTHDLARRRENVMKAIPEYRAIPYAFSEINGGVLGFRASEASSRWLNLWNHYFYKYVKAAKGWDQPALRIALWESKASIYVLPPEFNVRSRANRRKQTRFRRLYGKNHLRPRIYHMHYSSSVARGKFLVKSPGILKLVLRLKARMP